MAHSWAVIFKMKSALFFAFLAVAQSKWTDPLWHSFTPVNISAFSQSTVYNAIKSLSMIGEPIFFSGSNTSANYNDYTWFNPCFERSLTNDALYVYFWFIGSDAYCSIHKTVEYWNASTTAPFAQKYLARVEYIYTRCE